MRPCAIPDDKMSFLCAPVFPEPTSTVGYCLISTSLQHPVLTDNTIITGILGGLLNQIGRD